MRAWAQRMSAQAAWQVGTCESLSECVQHSYLTVTQLMYEREHGPRGCRRRQQAGGLTRGVHALLGDLSESTPSDAPSDTACARPQA